MKIFELVVKMLDEPIYVATLVERFLVTDRVCKSCKLKICSFGFTVNLIVLGIDDFNIILGVDWLSANHIFFFFG